MLVSGVLLGVNVDGAEGACVDGVGAVEAPATVGVGAVVELVAADGVFVT
jgi:hypothetical protein